MGLRVQLDPTTAQQGLDRLIVVGVKASLDGTSAKNRLAALLDAHHYTEGAAFVPTGTPTNNTTDAPAGYSSRRPDHSVSHRVERAAALVQAGDGSDGDLTARALGVSVKPLEHLWGADHAEQRSARSMNAALWPATWGYFLEQMMADVFPDSAIRHGRRHFIDYVRARGPLATLRLGNQPYGLLPVISLDRWSLLGSEVDARIVGFLRSVREVWRRSLARVPQVGRTGDPDRDLLEILGMEATSQSYAARSLMGRHYLRNLWSFMNVDVRADWWTRQEELAEVTLRSLGLTGNPRLARAVFAPEAFPLSAPLVQAGAVSETNALDPVPALGNKNYIEWLASGNTPYETIRDEAIAEPKPTALLYLLLRHATLLEYAAAATRILERRKLIVAAERVEPELVDVEPDRLAPTGSRRLDRAVPGVSSQRLGRFLQTLTTFSDPDVAELGEFRASLDHLSRLPTAPLARSFVETVDLASHRLDAWVTSFASKRLDGIRRQKPEGIYLGGYRWVEALRPRPAPTVVPPPKGEEGSPVTASSANAGYVHAPSLAHAATAAILRSGYLSRRRDATDDSLAVDLSSERVRLALWLLDGVRQGQPLGALLGYRFERGLHEHAGVRLDRFIQPFRELAPLVARKIEGASEPVDSIAARNVVDGLALERLFRAGGIVFGTGGLPAPTAGERDALMAELRALDDAVDAVGDAVLAESVYQLVQGNPLRAGSTLDAVAGGEAPPPELEVARTPRSGVVVTHRVMVLFSGEPAPPAGWRTSAFRARAQAEPHLNAWAARLLGNPTRVRCRGEYLDPHTGAVVSPPGVVEVSLGELELSPLDVICMGESDERAQQSELEERVRFRLGERRPASVPANATVRLDFGRDRTWPASVLSVSEFLELVRVARSAIMSSRAMDHRDLLPPAEVAASQADTTSLVGELEARATATVGRFRQARASLPGEQASPGAIDAKAVRVALLQLAHFGVPGAVPRTPAARHWRIDGSCSSRPGRSRARPAGGTTG